MSTIVHGYTVERARDEHANRGQQRVKAALDRIVAGIETVSADATDLSLNDLAPIPPQTVVANPQTIAARPQAVTNILPANLPQFTTGDVVSTTPGTSTLIFAAVGANTVIANPQAFSTRPVAVTAAQLRTLLGPAGRLDLQRAGAGGQGLIAETVPRMFCNIASVAPNALVTGVTYLSQVYLLAGEVITRAHVASIVASTGTMTLGRIGIYDAFNNPGSRLAQTNTVASWIATGQYTLNFTAPYTVPGSGNYFVAVHQVFTGNSPGLLCSLGSGFGVASAAAIGGAPTGIGVVPAYYVTSNAAFADLQNPLTYSLGFAAVAAPWVGLS